MDVSPRIKTALGLALLWVVIEAVLDSVLTIARLNVEKWAEAHKLDNLLTTGAPGITERAMSTLTSAALAVGRQDGSRTGS